MRGCALLLGSLLLAGCGGSSTGPTIGLTVGTYAAYVPPSGAQPWVASWPADVSQTGCAIVNGSITIVDGSTFTETRAYGALVLAPGSFSTERTFAGSYRSIPATNTWVFTVDGGTDTASAQSSSVSQSRDALVITRRFPLRSGCLVGGPYTIEYIK